MPMKYVKHTELVSFPTFEVMTKQYNFFSVEPADDNKSHTCGRKNIFF